MPEIDEREGYQPGLYNDPETGQRISTNSALKTFLRCPKQAEYKYARRLKPKQIGRPLTMGKWMHALLEAYYKELAGMETKPWREVHDKWSRDFSKLFDEEKDSLGDLPRDCAALMQAYIWHYKHHEIKVHGVEGMLETTMPDGTLFRGRYDMLIEDEYGMWLWDHKNFKRFPNFGTLLLDTQAPRYIYAARREGIPVEGFIWNYLKTKPMTTPTTIKDGSRLSKTTMQNCDFVTAARAVKAAGLDPNDYKQWLLGLKRQRYQHGQPQTSEFFQRVVFEFSDEALERLALATLHTSMRMHDYDFSDPDTVERVPDRSCDFMCSYKELCQLELHGGNTELTLRKNYIIEDPQAYYYDDGLSADKDSE